MSRSANSINPSYFMMDPFPLRDVEKSEYYDGRSLRGEHFMNGEFTDGQLTRGTSSPYFLKGLSENNANFEHVGGDDDLFVITNKDSSFTLSRNVLKETLYELKGLSNVQVKDLENAHTESFRGVVEALKLVYDVPAIYELVTGDIKDIFSDVTELKPGSVGAFFIGCLKDDKFTGPVGCSPICVASLPHTGVQGYGPCDDLVLIYSGDEFSSLNDKKSEHAYIYISDENFSGFSKFNINKLVDAGIKTVTLIFGNPDGSYKEIRSPTSLENLPMREEITYANNETTIVKNDVKQADVAPKQTSSGGAVFAFVILILVILGLVGFVMYDKYKK